MVALLMMRVQSFVKTLSVAILPPTLSQVKESPGKPHNPHLRTASLLSSPTNPGLIEGLSITPGSGVPTTTVG